MSTPEILVVAAYLGVLGVLSSYGLHRLFIVWSCWRTRDRGPAPGLLGELPRVTVQLPVFNERNVIERLIDAACALEWPADRLEIQVLDDSTDETTAVARRRAATWRSRGVDITVLHRTDRRGFKAGALEAGTAVAKGEFLAVFDADFVPQPDFLARAMPYFAGTSPGPGTKGIGMVQARWGHLNEEDLLLTQLSALLLDGHFVLEHTARNRTGRFFNFNGTAGIWRRQAILDAGGWEHDTLTEDLDLSYRAQLAGWQFSFLGDLVVPAELPADMRAFKLQQHRWAKGTLQAARKLTGRLLRSEQPWAVKLEALLHLYNNLAYPLVLVLALLMPLAVAARGHGSLSEALLLDLPAFLLATGSVALFYARAEADAHGRWLDKAWRLPLVMALGIGMSVNQTRAVLEGVFGKDLTFRRTPKAGDAASRRRLYRLPVGWAPLVELALAAWFLGGMAHAVANGWYASLPFMALFGWGFGYVGLASVAQALRPRLERRLPAAGPRTAA